MALDAEQLAAAVAEAQEQVAALKVSVTAVTAVTVAV